MSVERHTLCFALLLCAGACAQTGPANLDFERGEVGQVPAGWFVPAPAQKAGYSAALTEERPYQGRRSALIARHGTAQSEGFGNLMQSFSAVPYRNQRVRLRAAVRTEVAGPGNRAQLWLRVDRKGGHMGFFDNMGDRPITASAWREYEIAGDVAADAETINLGLMLIGSGKAWLDAVSFEGLGNISQLYEPSRPLQGRALENLVAFTKLLGYVRHFHPSDEAAATNWEAFAIDGVRGVENAKSPAELAQTLGRLFRPIAPTLLVFPTGEHPALPRELSPPRELPSVKIVAWRHYGLGTGAPNSIYYSRRLNRDNNTEAFGNLMQSFDASPYHGKRVRFRASVRAEVSGAGNQAQLWLRVDRKDGKMGFFDNMGDRPITVNQWREYEIAGEIAEDAERVFLGLLLAGDGRAWLDAVSVEILPAGGPSPRLANADFEEGEPGKAPRGWSGPQQGGYSLKISEDRPKSGKRCALIAREAPQPMSDPARPYAADLGGGVSCLVPISLYAGPEGTLPHTTNLAPKAATSGSGNDRASRLAAVALAWNILQHFYPYFDVVSTDWLSALRKALTAAATDPDEAAFLTTLRRLVAQLHDGHGRVSLGGGQASSLPPFLWDQVEGRLVITHVASDASLSLQAGDIVLRVDGKPAASALAEKEELVSGATVQFRSWRSLGDLLAGPRDSTITLELQPQSGATSTIAVRRTVSSAYVPEPRPPKIHEIRPGIEYADLTRITDQEFESALPRLEKATGIIFDLRGYPSRISPQTIGHLTDQPVTCARWLVPVVNYPDRQKSTFDFSNWTVEPKAPRLKAKAAFLTDGRAISYAETYLGIIEHYKLAEIVGQPTAGTNGNVNPITLPGGYRITWTGMKVLKHDGSQHHGVGILPTVPVSRTLRGVREGRDEFLERAIEIVSR